MTRNSLCLLFKPYGTSRQIATQIKVTGDIITSVQLGFTATHRGCLHTQGQKTADQLIGYN